MVHKPMKNLFVSLAIFSTLQTLNASSLNTLSTSKNFFQPRPASANLAREMLMEPGAHHRSSDSWYGEFAATAFYQHSWNQNNNTLDNGISSSLVGMQSLGAMPFWSGTNIMTIGNNINASTTNPTTLANVDSYQFGLGPITTGATASTITLNPVIYQAGADFMFIVGSSANE